MNRIVFAIVMIGVLTLTTDVEAGFDIALGPTEVVPNTNPGVPVYTWTPDGHISFRPDTTAGQYQMYWSGSSSYVTTGADMMTMNAPGAPALAPGGSGTFDNGGAWLMSVFRKSGNNMIGFYHGEDHEFPPDPNPGNIAWKSIAVCTSSDNGATWAKGGQIITSANVKPSTPSWGGTGDHCVVYDSANSRWVCYYQEHYIYMAISTDANGAPGTWYKYYNGGFTEAGLGGQNTPVPGIKARPGANPSVHYNTYLNKWVMVWHSWGTTEGSIWLSTSTDMINWDTPIAILTATGTEKMWYPTIIGTTDTEAGQEAWLCYAYWPDQAGSERQFLRRKITFQPEGAPVVPTGLSAVSLDGSVSLDWADNGELDLLHYDVYRSTTSGSGYVSIQSGLTTSNYVDATVTNGTTYYYVVTATDTTSNQSGYSDEVSATPNPDTDPPTPNPASFAIVPTGVSDLAINMTATSGSDVSGPVEYLFTETSGNPGGTSSGWQPSPVYTDTGLSPSTQYTYTITMRDAVGNIGTPSDPANATTLSTGLIQNGDFSDVMNHWYPWTYTGGGRTADFNVVNGELVVSNINSGGVASWISIVNSPISLAQGTTYKISFDARSAAPRLITVGPRKGSGDFSSYHTRKKLIDTTMKTYSFTYTHTDSSDSSAQMIFFLGETDDTVIIDNLTMVVIDSGPGPGPTFKLLAIGDSITQGNIYGAGTYRKPLYYELTDAGYNVDFVGSHDLLAKTNATDGRPDTDTRWDQDHEGWWGYPTYDVEALLPNAMLGYDFDVALIHLGTNDPNAAGIQNLKDIIDLLRTDNPNVVIFLAQLISKRDTADTTIPDYNALIPAVVSEKATAQSPVILVNQYTTLTSPIDYADGLHPNATGAAKMADVWFSAIDAYFTDPANQHTVTYDGNGHTGGTTPGDQVKISSINLTLAGNTSSLVKTGYTFTGWNTSTDGTGTAYAEGGTYSTDADLTLYAEWNAVPVANDDSVSTDKDIAVDVTLTGSDSDAGDTLTYTVVDGPTNGTLSGTAPNLTYTPDFHFSGNDSFTFKINDGTDDSNLATVVITVLGVRVIDYVAPTPGTVKTYKVAVLMLNTLTTPVADNPVTPKLEFYSPETLGQIYFEHQFGASTFLHEASYGKIAFEGRVIGWVDQPTAGLNGTDISGNKDYYFNLFKDYLTFSDYDIFVVHSLVEGGSQQTGWLYPQQSITTDQGTLTGIGIDWMANSGVFDDAPLNYSNWSSGDAVLPTTSWAHEMLHTLGITGHANSYDCADVTLAVDGASNPIKGYGDSFSIMGEYAYATHPNALMKSRIGWLTAAQLPEISSSGTYDVYPLVTADSQVKALVIPLAPPLTHTQTTAEFDALIVEYRTAVGFDRYLQRLDGSTFLSQYTSLTNIDRNGVLVYLRYSNTGTDSTALLDMNPTTTYNPARGIKWPGNAGKFADAILPVNQTFTWQNIQITPTGTTAEGAMSVSIIIGEPEMKVSGLSTEIADGDTSPDTIDDTAFGTVTVGNSASHTFTIENTGNLANLNLTGAPLVTITGSAEFSVTAQPTTPVAAGDSTTFEVTFTPADSGTPTATVSIASDDADENPYTFVVGGTGQTTGSPIADVTLRNGLTIIGYTGENPIDAETAFADLITAGQLVNVRWIDPANGFTKELYESPVFGWVNDIGNLTLGEGYIVRTNAQCTLSISGNKSTASVSHDLRVLSILGFNQETPINAATAFAELITAEKLLNVRWIDADGFTQELYESPVFGWVNDIGNLTEGQGYIIKLNATHDGFTLP